MQDLRLGKPNRFRDWEKFYYSGDREEPRTVDTGLCSQILIVKPIL